MHTQRWLRMLLAALFLAVLGLGGLVPSALAQTPTYTFTNPASIAISASGDKGPGSPYPSEIAVGGLPGTIRKVTVTLQDINHTYPDDINALLVGPHGQTTFLMADAGGGRDYDLTHVTLIFDDQAAQALPDRDPLSSGSYRPANYGAAFSLPAPAPAWPYGATLGAFYGANPNGTWCLYVYDDANGDVGTISGGWALTITTNSAASSGLAAPRWDPGDGRLNSEPAAPLAIYCDSDSVYAYIPDYLEFDFPLDQIGDGAAAELLTTGVTGARLYRLDTGELQVNMLNGGEEYVFTWDACPMTRSTTRVYDVTTGALLADSGGG